MVLLLSIWVFVADSIVINVGAHIKYTRVERVVSIDAFPGDRVHAVFAGRFNIKRVLPAIRQYTSATCSKKHIYIFNTNRNRLARVVARRLNYIMLWLATLVIFYTFDIYLFCRQYAASGSRAKTFWLLTSCMFSDASRHIHYVCVFARVRIKYYCVRKNVLSDTCLLPAKKTVFRWRGKSGENKADAFSPD